MLYRLLLLQYGETPVYKASECGHLQVVELFLSKGAEVDSRDEVSTYNNVMYCVIVIIQSVCSIVCEVP